MRSFIIALLVSIILHLIILFLHFEQKKIEAPLKQSPKTSSIKYVKLAPKKPTIDSLELVESKIQKSKQETKNLEQEAIKKEFLTPPSPIPPIPKKKTKTIEIPTKKEEHQPKAKEDILQEKVKQASTSSLVGELSKPKTRAIDELTQTYLNLYGDEYYSFSDETKEFLKENLSDIGKITQKYLMYPSISIRTKQQGQNVVEFYLHPNGDITDLKLLKSSTYSALDSNSIHTIKVAYKDYPKPKEVTKIRIFVHYKLY